MPVLSLTAEPGASSVKVSFMHSMAMVLLCGWLVCPAQASDWSGKGEFGLVFARGNSDTETLNLGLEFERETETWRNHLRATALRSSDDGELNAERYTLAYKSGYNLDEVSYLLGAARYDRDEFSSFDYQASASVGYGRELLGGETHRLTVEFGPGVRWSEPKATGSAESELIGRLSGDYAWTLSDTGNLSNVLLVEAGSDNTFAENETALNVAINSRFALKIALAVRHNTDTEPGVEETDTLTTANLVYTFGER